MSPRAPAPMRYVNVHRLAELPDVSHLAPFKALVSIDAAVSAEREAEICRWLVEMGCRYVVCRGDGCESWRESVRAANVERFGVEQLTARDFVMATSHPYESLRAVMWYAKHAAKHPEHAFAALLVLHVGDGNRAVEFEAIFQKA